MQLVTEKQLQQDIKNLPIDYNKGRSEIMKLIGTDNIVAARQRDQSKTYSRARAKLNKKKNSVPAKAFSGKNIILKDYSLNLRKVKEAEHANQKV